MCHCTLYTLLLDVFLWLATETQIGQLALKAPDEWFFPAAFATMVPGPMCLWLAFKQSPDGSEPQLTAYSTRAVPLAIGQGDALDC
jgi:hypothetical protein